MSTGTASASAARIRNKGDVGRHDYRADMPTIFLGFSVYAAFLLLTWFYHDLPWWVVLPLGASVICLHGSLQHEAVHGYPFQSQTLNRLFSGWALWLWMPYDNYVHSHLKHHIDEDLTAPLIDPESNYLTAAQLAGMSAPHRLVRQAMRTLAGRMLLGPAYYAVNVLRYLLRDLREGNGQRLRAWAWHLPSTTLILYWVIGICDIPLWAYVALFAYPGTSMALVRSFAEHRAMPDERQRTIILEAGPFWSVMFLWNNLHALHHAEPGLAWHRRPSRYRELKPALLAANGNYFVQGYAALAKKYFLRPKEPLLHPYSEPA